MYFYNRNNARLKLKIASSVPHRLEIRNVKIESWNGIKICQDLFFSIHIGLQMKGLPAYKYSTYVS